MNRFRFFNWRKVTLVAVLSILQVMTPSLVFAQSPVKLQNWMGRIEYHAGGVTPFVLQGTASHLGNFMAEGEVTLLPTIEGALAGDGVVVFKAANGDLLAGVVEMTANADTPGSIHFSWRDSVQFSNGNVVNSTGRFADAAKRPPGLVVIAIIAILIGLLLPAVQKVR